MEVRTTMASTASNGMAQWETKYHDITELYRLADELLATVEDSPNPEMQLGLVEALVSTIGDSTDVLSEEYIGLIEGNEARRKAAKPKVEGALRKIYSAIGDFKTRARDVRNAAYRVVDKLRRQLEQVIVNFAELVSLAIDRVMQKYDVEALKARHASIALMLYSKGQGQST
jgi:hypothetical protein